MNNSNSIIKAVIPSGLA